MADSMFQKDFNDEISVNDLQIPNPSPSRLEVRYIPDGQVFSAMAGWVLKSIYSSADSLAAFSSDDEIQVFLCYARQSSSRDPLFIQHARSAGRETLQVVSFDALPMEARDYVPQDFR